MEGLNKYSPGKAEMTAFFAHNPQRDLAIKHYESIKLDFISMYDFILWMDSDKVSTLKLTEYHLMRAAISGNDWERTLECMKRNPDNLLIQYYGLHNFSKTNVPLDKSGVIDFITANVIEWCLKIIIDRDDQYDPLHKIYTMRAFYNIMSVRPSRSEYLNEDLVQQQGEEREGAVERFYKDRLGIFNKYLTKIPCETFHIFEKGQREPTALTKPAPRGVELVENALRCLTLFAQEIEPKEIFSSFIVVPTLFSMNVSQLCTDCYYHRCPDDHINVAMK